jgi:hypothetical protein
MCPYGSLVDVRANKQRVKLIARKRGRRSDGEADDEGGDRGDGTLTLALKTPQAQELLAL